MSTTYLLDGSQVVTENNNGSLSQTLYGPGTDHPLARNGEFFLTNHLGSTTLLTTSGGSAGQSYQYSPFGALLGSPTDSNPFQFTGRENDGDGLMYYRARYYNPAWGRFISVDPSGLAGGINPYVYAGNNPVNATDPTGQAKSPRPGVPPDFRPPTAEEWGSTDTWRFGFVGIPRGGSGGTPVPGPYIYSGGDPDPRVQFHPDGTYKPPKFTLDSDINPRTGRPYFIETNDVAPEGPSGGGAGGAGGALGLAFILVTPNPYDNGATPLDRVLDLIWDLFHPKSSNPPAGSPPSTVPDGDNHDDPLVPTPSPGGYY